MKPAKICVYAIALNEIKHVDLFMAACKDADLVMVCDTGSTDGTPERLRELGATVYDIKQSPWRFDHARNTALSLVPADVDLCYSIDIDEYLQPGWYEAAQKIWTDSNGTVTRISYDYTWSWMPDGVTPASKFNASKFHSRHDYTWRHPCHEIIYYSGNGKEVSVTCLDIQLHHRADNTKSRSSYLGLLKLGIDEDPHGARARYYYARELMYVKQYEESVKEFDAYLALPTAWWAEERAAALTHSSNCLRALGKKHEALKKAQLATIEFPHSREPWMELARSAYDLADWSTCFYAVSKALQIKEATPGFVSDPRSWGHEIYDLAALSSHYLGLEKLALLYGQTALDLNPSDGRLQKNMQFYEQAIQA